MSFPKHHSLTHLHIFSCLATLLKEKLVARQSGEPIRILDIGCGDGRLVGYLHAAFGQRYPHVEFELYGFDIGEQGYGVGDEYSRAIFDLSASCPAVDWSTRLSMISARDPWPFSDGFFDAAVSNQVIEHVEDGESYLRSLKRVLKKDGASVHVFPLGHTILEGHIKVPFAHWIRDADLQRGWIALSNRLGIGNWRRDRTIFDDPDIEQYAKNQAAYIHSCTYYRSFAELHRLCKGQGLDISSAYTPQLFSAKLRSLLGKSPQLEYRSARFSLLRWISFVVLRYISSSTIVMKPVFYDIGARIHAEKELQSRKVSASSAISERLSA